MKMSFYKIDPITIAVRVYPEPRITKQRASAPRQWKLPDAMLVFDTETRTDPTQRLTFGGYRFLVEERCLEEGLVFGDDLPEKERRVLENYVATHSADVVKEGVPQLQLLTRSQFVDKLY